MWRIQATLFLVLALVDAGILGKAHPNHGNISPRWDVPAMQTRDMADVTEARRLEARSSSPGGSTSNVFRGSGSRVGSGDESKKAPKPAGSKKKRTRPPTKPNTVSKPKTQRSRARPDVSRDPNWMRSLYADRDTTLPRSGQLFNDFDTWMQSQPASQAVRLPKEPSSRPRPSGRPFDVRPQTLPPRHPQSTSNVFTQAVPQRSHAQGLFSSAPQSQRNPSSSPSPSRSPSQSWSPTDFDINQFDVSQFLRDSPTH